MSRAVRSRFGFSLVEVLVAAALTLLLALVAVQMIGMASNSVASSRGIMEASGRLRSQQRTG